MEQPTIQRGEDPFSYDVQGSRPAELSHKLVETVTKNGSLLEREILFLSEDDRALTAEEADFFFTLSHPTLPVIHGLMEGVVGGKKVRSMVRDKVQGKTLEEQVKEQGALDVKDAVSYIRQAADLLNTIHKASFLCPGINPSTMVLDGTRVMFNNILSLEEQQEEKVKAKELSEWDYPDMDASATIQRDLFSLGMSLYYLVVGQKPELEQMEDGYGIRSDDLVILKAQCLNVEGAPELRRTIERLTHPKNHYQSTEEALKDLKDLETVTSKGYDSLENQQFLVHQPSAFREIGKGLYAIGRVIKKGTFAALKFPFTTSKALYSFATEDALRIGISAGIVVSGGAGWIINNYLESESASREVYLAPEVQEEASPFIRTAAALSNIANTTGALYVRMHGKGGEKPNDIQLSREMKALQEEIQRGFLLLQGLDAELLRVTPPIQAIANGGKTVRGSYVHAYHDNYHTEMYTVPVTTCSGSGRDSHCSTHLETRTRQVYDDTDHAWTFHSLRCRNGLAELKEGVKGLHTAPLQNVVPHPYLARDAPEQDVLGRAVLDAKHYVEGQNEWIREGLVPAAWVLATPSSVSDHRDFRQLLQDETRGLAEHREYPSHYELTNTCSGCDEQQAPRGYITTKRVGQLTDSFAGNYHLVHSILLASPGVLQTMNEQLTDLQGRLEAGKRVHASDLTDIADSATKLYTTLVPDTKIAAPTAAERKWWPIGIGGMLFLLCGGIGFGINARNASYSGGYGYRRGW